MKQETIVCDVCGETGHPSGHMGGWMQVSHAGVTIDIGPTCSERLHVALPRFGEAFTRASVAQRRDVPVELDRPRSRTGRTYTQCATWIDGILLFQNQSIVIDRDERGTRLTITNAIPRAGADVDLEAGKIVHVKVQQIGSVTKLLDESLCVSWLRVESRCDEPTTETISFLSAPSQTAQLREALRSTVAQDAAE